MTKPWYWTYVPTLVGSSDERRHFSHHPWATRPQPSMCATAIVAVGVVQGQAGYQITSSAESPYLLCSSSECYRAKNNYKPLLSVEVMAVSRDTLFYSWITLVPAMPTKVRSSCL